MHALIIGVLVQNLDIVQKYFPVIELGLGCSVGCEDRKLLRRINTALAEGAQRSLERARGFGEHPEARAVRSCQLCTDRGEQNERRGA